MPAPTILAELRGGAAQAAMLCDIDGTLAPIVSDPDAAVVPGDTRRILRKLATRYRLVACISGRPARVARRMVGLSELAYAGNHGLELLWPGQEEPGLHPALGNRASAVARFVAALDPGQLSIYGVRLEDKGPIQALHWRGAEDEARAETFARGLAQSAGEQGLVPHFGRKVLEIRPVAEVDKGVAVKRLVAESKVERALFAGDDRTDLDGFAAVRELTRAGALELGICVGVRSEEGPAEIRERADLTVAGTEGFRELLRGL